MATSKCETYIRPVLTGYSPSKECWLIFQPRCKMWACPYCATQNKWEWVKIVREGIDWYKAWGEKQWYFLTVTSHEKNVNLVQCLYVWPDAWGKLSRKMRYHYPGLRYVLLPEQHKDGRLHIHMIANRPINTAWLRKHARKSGLGYQCKGERINDGYGSIRYTSKYLGKSASDTSWPSGFRRVRTSLRWPRIPSHETEVWNDVEWTYLCSYPNDGLEYLRDGLAERNKTPYSVLR